MERVCLITNYNLYESKRYFTQKLSEALERQGVKTLILDAQEEAFNSETIKSIQEFKPSFTCSFNTLLATEQGYFLWDLLNIPHLAFLVDPVLYSIELINSPLSIISCVDRGDCEALQEEVFFNQFFLPHAVEKELVQPSTDANKPYDVAFIGTCYDFEALKAHWQATLPLPLQRILETAIDISWTEPYTSHLQALSKAWSLSDLTPHGNYLKDLFFYLDYYTRGKDRVELIRSIKDAQVHVFGSNSEDIEGATRGWKDYLSDCKNITVHPPVSFSESLNLLKQTKICLNSMPFFKDGSHERILTGLSCGALPFTTQNRYIEDQFKDIEFYGCGNYQTVNERVGHLLQNTKERENKIKSGQAVVLANHTWDQRVQTLFKEVPALLKRTALFKPNRED